MESKGKTQLFCYVHSLLHKMMLFIIETKDNKRMLLLDTFRYTQDKILNTTIYWKCESRSCPRRAMQYGSNSPSMKKPHNCNGDEIKCKVKEF